jgi:hypothetical protein
MYRYTGHRRAKGVRQEGVATKILIYKYFLKNWERSDGAGERSDGLGSGGVEVGRPVPIAGARCCLHGGALCVALRNCVSVPMRGLVFPAPPAAVGLRGVCMRSGAALCLRVNFAVFR